MHDYSSLRSSFQIKTPNVQFWNSFQFQTSSTNPVGLPISLIPICSRFFGIFPSIFTPFALAIQAPMEGVYNAEYKSITN